MKILGSVDFFRARAASGGFEKTIQALRPFTPASKLAGDPDSDFAWAFGRAEARFARGDYGPTEVGPFRSTVIAARLKSGPSDSTVITAGLKSGPSGSTVIAAGLKSGPSGSTAIAALRPWAKAQGYQSGPSGSTVITALRPWAKAQGYQPCPVKATPRLQRTEGSPRQRCERVAGGDLRLGEFPIVCYRKRQPTLLREGGAPGTANPEWLWL